MAEEFTRGCYGAHFAPGVWTSYGEAWRAPAGRIHWAGAECSPRWNGYMEGAVRSGEAAAAAVAPSCPACPGCSQAPICSDYCNAAARSEPDEASENRSRSVQSYQ